MSNIQIYNMFRNKKELKNGCLIACEGLDGSGKNTQVKNLEEYISNLGYKVKTYSFPQYEKPIGKVIASYLRGDFGDLEKVPYELISLTYAADRVELASEIRSLLSAGYIILIDRYTYSNVFSIAKMPKNEWLERIDWLEDMEFNQLRVVKPHFNIYLHVDPKISLQRIAERGKRDYQEGKDDIHESNNKLLINASDIYLDLASTRSDWYLINQMQNSNQITKEEAFNKLKDAFHKIIGE